MVTKLKSPLKREIEIDSAPYVVAISAEGIKLTKKGHRIGVELAWKSMLGADAAPAVATNAAAEADAKHS